MRCTPVDPFDLPEWLGTHEVTWSVTGTLSEPLVAGLLTSDEDGTTLPVDLLAVDVAYPEPIVDEATRAAVHEAWRRGELYLVRVEDRLTMTVPAVHHSADEALEVIGRFAQAVAAPRRRYGLRLRAGR